MSDRSKTFIFTDSSGYERATVHVSLYEIESDFMNEDGHYSAHVYAIEWDTTPSLAALAQLVACLQRFERPHASAIDWAWMQRGGGLAEPEEADRE